MYVVPKKSANLFRLNLNKILNRSDYQYFRKDKNLIEQLNYCHNLILKKNIKYLSIFIRAQLLRNMYICMQQNHKLHYESSQR